MAAIVLSRDVHYFLAVAEHLSFTRAAGALHISQPALSQQVKQLEEGLGVQLFDRSGRTTRLTDAGEVYLQYVRRALLQLREGTRAIHDVSNLASGSVRIAITPTFTSYLVGPVFEAFHGRHPNITVSVREMSQERAEELLLADEVDIGLAFAEVRSPGIAHARLLVETLALVVRRGHPLEKEVSIGLQDLHAETLVLLSAEFATREQIDRFCLQNAINPRIQFEANSISAVIEIVRSTGLSTLLPANIALGYDDLIAIELDTVRLERTAVLIQRRDAYQSAAARAFVEVARQVAREVETATSVRRP
ncbi:transcriptional regulator CynR [Luteibacter jiangsuensis]|uniref:Transcriptional regulator CynR n=1 Tax=Luteibacter jiangsuensis TaxID=637577 RepID=A0ABX0Q5U8_9GAMM|nr:transcriptional regulator CynR [Luteibacter jiangsuensis]NID05767.1 transcriptional regulator CynR [Luteibacter jiangsuensis]